MKSLSTLFVGCGLVLAPLFGQAQDAPVASTSTLDTQNGVSAELECLILTGRVTNAFNAPLSGATVLLRGTNLAYSTNSEGNYVLSTKTPLPRNTKLLISAAGYTSVELELANCTPLDVSLDLLPGTKLKSNGRIKKTAVTGKIK